MADEMPQRDDASLAARLGAFWRRHRTLFWTLHSLWALATGALVVWLARDRYGFVPWVVLFLVLTWVSTLYFGRRIPEGGDPGLGQEATSYLTRVMYQETLFFLLPFYASSTVPGSLNMVFLGGLGALAVLSCLDLVFDRWLRTSPAVSVGFFAIVAFAALNLLLPVLLPIPPARATPIAILLAVLGAFPLAHAGRSWTRTDRIRAAIAAVVLLAVGIGAPQLVPPVPLQLEDAAFGRDIDRTTLQLADTIQGAASVSDVDGRVVVLVRVFAPTVVPTRVHLVWERDGRVVRESRDVEILAHDQGFRIWDAWPPEGTVLEPGRYDVILRTGSGRTFGRARVTLTAS